MPVIFLEFTVKQIGVLRYQGDFERHLHVFDRLGTKSSPVRTVSDLETVDALVIPGGESTTIGMLIERFGLLEPLRRRIASGFPVLGTCAGAILLANTIESSDQVKVGGMDIVVRRNAYGTQVDSFEADIHVPRLGDPPVRGVFIRAPRIVSAGPGVEVLAGFEDYPVAALEANVMVLTFHPELTEDDRFHRHFLEMVG